MQIGGADPDPTDPQQHFTQTGCGFWFFMDAQVTQAVQTN
jgi:hypothetical protein